MPITTELPIPDLAEILAARNRIRPHLAPTPPARLFRPQRPDRRGSGREARELPARGGLQGPGRNQPHLPTQPGGAGGRGDRGLHRQPRPIHRLCLAHLRGGGPDRGPGRGQPRQGGGHGGPGRGGDRPRPGFSRRPRASATSSPGRRAIATSTPGTSPISSPGWAPRPWRCWNSGPTWR